MSIKVLHYISLYSNKTQTTELSDFTNPYAVFHPDQIISIKGEILVKPETNTSHREWVPEGVKVIKTPGHFKCRGCDWGCLECIPDADRLRAFQGTYS